MDINRMLKDQIPRPEHPRPQFCRNTWLCLNGEWSYEFDFGESGMDPVRGMFRSAGFGRNITVPFCPESELSGVGHKDFIPAIWYHRTMEVPSEWGGKRILLHFGAVDYECEVFIDGVSAGLHFGGTVSFTFDITKWIQLGKTHHLVVRVKDDLREGNQPAGKQCFSYKSKGCHYTRTTGIWQTVWLEAVAPYGLKDIHIVPDFDSSSFVIIPRYLSVRRRLRLVVLAKANGAVAAEADIPAVDGVPAVLQMASSIPWDIENPFLYDLELKVVDDDGRVLDEVSSYAGLRKVHIEGNRIYLNNKPVYQRLVLDQGFYPEGIWTAPSDEALKNDILLAKKAGFNGARLHQKVFEERFHYWADRLGYITWGESSSWGCDCNTPEGARNFISEWLEIIVRDRNHPSIIIWTPWNETRYYNNPGQHKRVHMDAYKICKDLDPTRAVNDASGYLHHITDVWTVHDYEQDPERLRKNHTPDPDRGVFRNMPEYEPEYEGQPYLIDEYGGMKWVGGEAEEPDSAAWGYGDDSGTLDAFYTRLEGLTDVILSRDHICGYCYTQLTDVEQEQNGIYYFDRSEKFDMKRIAQIFKKERAAS